MTTVDEIRARRNAIDAYLEADYPTEADYAAYTVFKHDAHLDIDYLLAELDKRDAVVDAAQAYRQTLYDVGSGGVDDAVNVELRAQVALMDALAACDAGEGA